MSPLFSVALTSLLFTCGSLGASIHPRQLVGIKSILAQANFSSSTTVSYPGQAYFENVTERWTTFDPPTFSASVSAGNQQDVVNAVKVAKSANIPFLATGGRHGYNTKLGGLQNGLSIDLSGLNTVSVNKQAQTMTIGPGVRFRDIVGPLAAAGLQIQTGTCSCPGMMGVTIGAGIGRLQGTYGLLSDALISATVVTASGEVLVASATSNTDLYWGIRGAGANLGIITSATYGVHPVFNGGNFTSIDMIFTASQNVSYFNALAKTINQNAVFPSTYNVGYAPSKLTGISNIAFDATSGQPEIIANWVYAGPEDEAMRAMAPILAVGPVFTNKTIVQWEYLNTATSFGLDSVICEPEQIREIYGANMRTLSAQTGISTFQKMTDFYAKYPQGRGSAVSLESFPPQKVREIPITSNAYPWRDTITYLLVELTWAEADASAVSGPANALGAQIRSDFAKTSGYPDLSVYVNYAHGDEKPEQVFGVQLPRLQVIKKKYDPQNMFQFNIPIPT